MSNHVYYEHHVKPRLLWALCQTTFTMSTMSNHVYYEPYVKPRLLWALCQTTFTMSPMSNHVYYEHYVKPRLLWALFLWNKKSFITPMNTSFIVLHWKYNTRIHQCI